MGGFLAPVIEIVIIILNLYWWVIIVSIVVSWLTMLGVINTYNRSVAMALDILHRLTDPVYRPIRQFLPDIRGIDLSPLVVLLVIYFAERELMQLELYLYRN
jgi:YggT family protein